jgi:coenzyme F420-reducing hydrogenase beta subunit
MACVDACSHAAISIQTDIAAYNAVIQEEKCVHCNRCRDVCPNGISLQTNAPLEWHQGWALDQQTRLMSSSGGYAAAISQAFVREGGVVCSCAFSGGQFGFTFADTELELKKFQGSKYVKSNPGGIYKAILARLNRHERVLFIGLPCQVSAIKKFVGHQKQENLYTVDLICHGTPSPKVLEIYLQQNGMDLRAAEDVNFRNKHLYQLCVDGKSIGTPGVSDSYMVAFLNGLIHTENCYSCRYAKIERVSDLTLGDSWGSDILTLHKADGVSLVLCQTVKGQELLRMAGIHMEKVDLQNAIEHNQQLRRPPVQPVCREMLLRKLRENKNFNRTVFRLMPKDGIKRTIKSILLKTGVRRY